MPFVTTRMHVNELCEKHKKEDKCAVCDGFKENWLYTYDEIHQLYLGHLRHLYVFQYSQYGKKETCAFFATKCQAQGFFESKAKFMLWTISYNAVGVLVFSRF